MPASDTSRPPSSALASLVKLQRGIPLNHSGGVDIEHYLYERYVEGGRPHRHRLYYRVKRFLPRPVQLSLRRLYSSVQATRSFPAWPIESTVVTMVRESLAHVLSIAGEAHRLSPWPNRNQCAFAITHDVESDAGLRNVPVLAKMEKELGFLSSWNIVPERYPIDWSIVEALRAEGFEIGIHGLKHDGKLFDSYESFRSRVRKINEYARAWGAAGFRSPSTFRHVEWMPDLAFEYDSSFPDTDPYEPQPGGCCSIWPFFIGHLVELPITLPQDHTLFEILGHHDSALWRNKADWIEQSGGLVLIDVHPDYMLSKERLRLYEELLLHMKEKPQCWHALPREIARWWRDRDASEVCMRGTSWVTEGPAAPRGSILRMSLDDTGALWEEVIG